MKSEAVTSWGRNPKELVEKINASSGDYILKNSTYSQGLTISSAELKFGKFIFVSTNRGEIPIFEGIDKIEKISV